MKQNLLLSIALLLSVSLSFAQDANRALSNLTAPTAVNTDLLPGSTNTRNLGSSSKAWKNLYLQSDIYLDGTRFVSNYPGTASLNTFAGSHSGSAITTGTYNTAIGFNTMLKQTSGSHNTALGANALYYNISGLYNTALGRGALHYNTGDYNTATGAFALNSNTQGFGNLANGSNALYKNTEGSYNTATGYLSLYNNNTGDDNTGYGPATLQSNTTGSYNAASGTFALQSNTSGNYNTATGAYSLFSGETGSYNTALGYLAGSSFPNLSNTTSIGYNASATASNQVMLGNSSVTSVKAAGSFVIYSDGRYKKNIKQNVPGLEFINQLKPLTYNYDVHGLDKHITGNNRSKIAIGAKLPLVKEEEEEEAMTNKEKKLYTGFIAQDVEAAAAKVGYEFSGVHKPESDNDIYGLSYADFVIPLVKAVQELDVKIQDENKKLREEITLLKQMIMELKSKSTLTDFSGSSSFIEQNIPNPFSNTTTIRYKILSSSNSAKLTVTNLKGQIIKSLPINNKGAGQINLTSATLPAGTYNYTLWVDGKQADTKRLIIVR